MSLASWLFAAMYDRLLAGTEQAGLAARRQDLLAKAAGRVLEIGAGTGANLPFYGDAVEEVLACEPAEQMARRLERKRAACRRPLTVLRAPAEHVPLEDASVDVVVSTLVLCTVANQSHALGELHRVLKPGGRLLFLEHVRSEDPRLARWQDRLNFLNRHIAQGCNCNRNTLDAITRAGFTLGDVISGSLPKAPPIVRPLVAGTALRP